MNPRTVDAAEHIGVASYEASVSVDRTAIMTADLSEVERRFTHAIIIKQSSGGSEVRITSLERAEDMARLLAKAIESAKSGLGGWTYGGDQ